MYLSEKCSLIRKICETYYGEGDNKCTKIWMNYFYIGMNHPAAPKYRNAEKYIEYFREIWEKVKSDKLLCEY